MPVDSEKNPKDSSFTLAIQDTVSDFGNSFVIKAVSSPVSMSSSTTSSTLYYFNSVCSVNSAASSKQEKIKSIAQEVNNTQQSAMDIWQKYLQSKADIYPDATTGINSVSLSSRPKIS